MPIVQYKGKPPEQRIADRLRSSSPSASMKVQDRLPADATKETNPMRTVSNCYYGGSQTPQTKGTNNGY
jgi:hypothetical protein